MTEEEAKRRWCPFARMVAGTVEDGRSSHDLRQHSYNRVASADAIALVTGASCIGSQCMAWRWMLHVPGELIQAIKDYRAKHDCDLLTAKNAVEAARQHQTRRGYCGLAGEPQ